MEEECKVEINIPKISIFEESPSELRDRWGSEKTENI